MSEDKQLHALLHLHTSAARLFFYLELVLALKVFHQALEVDVRHLAKKRQEARHVLSLPKGKTERVR